MTGGDPVVIPRAAAGRFSVVEVVGSPAAVHGADPAPGEPAEASATVVPLPAVWDIVVDRPALVLGSAQRRLPADGSGVVRRRSGGGAVHVDPDTMVWFDVFVGPDDPQHRDDITASFFWLGEVWAEVLAGYGLTPEVHRAGLLRRRWSAEVCFAGLGPGEVTVGGRKVVGLSQRRTRRWSRFQCSCLLRWSPADHARLAPAEAAAEVADAAVGLAELVPGSSAAVVRRDFLARLATR